MVSVTKYLSSIGRRGGLKSRRTLSPETARAMVSVREARRAFRRFYSECFASTAPDRKVMRDDVAWVAAQLLRYGGDAAQVVGRRLAGAISLSEAPKGPRDTAPAAEAVQTAALRRQRPADRIRQALQLSESTRAIGLTALRRWHPEQTDRELVELLLGSTLPSRDRSR